jgi:hypothetical protein
VLGRFYEHILGFKANANATEIQTQRKNIFRIPAIVVMETTPPGHILMMMLHEGKKGKKEAESSE